MSDLNNSSCACGCQDNNNTPAGIYNAPGLSELFFRLGTHGSFKKEMLGAISKYAALSKLTTRDDDDFAIATLDAWATVLDVLTFYQERICNEGYLRTAIERLSTVCLAQHIRYIPAPGLAASTCLAFLMNESKGAPSSAIIPVGTKVQSIPGQNQMPQIFETIEQINAKVKWNRIKPLKKSLYTPKMGDSIIYLDGIQTGLQQGDKLLFVAPDHKFNTNDKDWDFRSVVSVTTNEDTGYTIVNLDSPIGTASNLPQIIVPAVNTQIVMKAADYPVLNIITDTTYRPGQGFARSSVLNATYMANQTFLSMYSPPVIKNTTLPPPVSLEGKALQVYAMRQKANLFGYNAPDYKTVSQSVKSGYLASGILGSYYKGTSFNQFLSSHVADHIDFSIPDGSATSTFPIPDKVNFSVRWVGFVLAPVSGNINFQTSSDDGVKLIVNNEVLIDNWHDHPQMDDQAGIALQAGQLYSIQLEYYQSNAAGSNPAVIKLSWSYQGTPSTLVPNQNLFYYGNNNDWADFSIAAIAPTFNQTIYLDNLYPKIQQDSLVVMATPDSDGRRLFSVLNTAESSQSRFTLTSKATMLKLSANPDFSKYNLRIRDTFIYAQSEELKLAEMPIIEPLNSKEITLESLVPDLFAGQKIFISGKRWRLQIPASAGEVFFTPVDSGQPPKSLTDTSLVIVEQPVMVNKQIQYSVIDDGGLRGTITDDVDPLSLDRWTPKKLSVVPSEKDDDILSELNTIEFINFVGATDSTQYGTYLKLKEPINTYFDLLTVEINANVAVATHGETKREVLGNGDGSQAFQKFQLKQIPLTFTSAENAKGAETTLEIRVNNIKWNEVSSFYGTLPKDKIFTTSIADNGVVSICFGDGITGSRLPTGIGNVQATYRTGIGLDGLMDAEQLSMLITPQLGVSKVVNPVASFGAQDPETLDSIQRNAPLTVLTLDRIVSVKDFESFARSFAGIAKARADVIWYGQQKIINITVASSDGSVLAPSDQLYNKLLSALADSGHTNSAIRLAGYKLSPFTIKAALLVDENYDVEIVKQNVVIALYDRFSFDAMNFGEDITAAQVINIIQNVAGVIYVKLEQMGNEDPFAIDNYRLSPAIPKLNGDGSVQQAELLVIDVNNSTINLINA